MKKHDEVSIILFAVGALVGGCLTGAFMLSWKAGLALIAGYAPDWILMHEGSFRVRIK